LLVERNIMTGCDFMMMVMLVLLKKIDEIREVLEVWPSDNLRNARFVLVVEGENDKIIISKIISSKSDKMRR